MISKRLHPASFSNVNSQLASKANIAQGSLLVPTLINSWVAFDNVLYPCWYFKDTLGFVHVNVALKTGASGTTAFTLPTGYRPEKIVIGSSMGAAATIAKYQIDSGGLFTVTGTTISTAFYSGEIIFRAA